MRYKRPGSATVGGPRSGFTLVELLVVIAIIAVLVSLSGAAYFRWIATQAQDTTETTMRDVAKVLERQMKQVIDRAKKEPESNIPLSVRTMAGGDMRRARVIWIKLRLKQEFPMTYAEALFPWQAVNSTYNLPPADLPPKRTYVVALGGAGISATNCPPDDGTQSSAMLLLALSQVRGGVKFNPGDLPSTAVGDTNSDGMKEIVDAWVKPLAFYRWPVGNAELISMNPAPANTRAFRFADAIDPDGLLLNPAWYSSNARAQFENLCHPISPNNGQSAFYILPTLASAGPDNILGLQPSTLTAVSMMATTNPPATLDNIYSYRLRMGARGSAQ